MNYKKVYDDFIADRRTKEADLIASGEYCERHHIRPRNMQGSDDADNLIALTAGDHYFAHLCLAKIHGDKQWTAVWATAGMTANDNRRIELFAHRPMVEIARIKSAEAMSGVKSPNADKTVYAWRNIRSGEVFDGTRYDLADRLNINKHNVQAYFLNDDLFFLAKEWYVVGVNFKTVKEAKAKRAQIDKMIKEQPHITRNTGTDHPMSLAVINLSTGEEYESLTAAGEALNIEDISNLAAHCKYHRTYKSCDAVWMYKKDYTPEKAKALLDRANNHVKKKTSLKVKNIDTGDIFESGRSAAKSIGIMPSGITACLKGYQKTAGGYRWSYA